MCAKTATSFLVELLSILKETVYRDRSAPVFTAIYKRISICDVTSYSLLWMAKSSKKDLLLRKNVL